MHNLRAPNTVSNECKDVGEQTKLTDEDGQNVADARQVHNAVGEANQTCSEYMRSCVGQCVGRRSKECAIRLVDDN